MSNSTFQNSYYISLAFNGILYGIELVLYVQTIQTFFQKGSMPSRTSRFFSIFNTALLLLVTIFLSVQAAFGQEMWIVNTGFQGGSATYLATHNNVWYRTLGTAASIVLQLTSDAFLIYRCFTVYGAFPVLIFPFTLWIVALVFGILHLCYPSAPSGGSPTGLTADIGIAYVSIFVGLNVIVSCMIVARVVYLARMTRISHTAKRKEQKYTGTIPTIVEAALLYAISGIAFVVSYATGSGVSIVFLSIYVMCSCLSPQLIIMRIAGGRSWKRYRRVTSSIIGLHVLTSTEVTHTADTGDKVSLDPQSRSPDPDP